MSNRFPSSRPVALVVVVVSLCLILSSCSLFGGDEKNLKAGGAHTVGEKVSTHVTPGDAFTINVPGVATITGTSGAVTSPGTITAQAAVGDDVSGIEVAGKGVDVTFNGTQLSEPLEVTFKDVNLPSDSENIPGVLHRADDGTTNVLPAEVLPNGDLRVSTKDFSINLPILVEAKEFVSGVFDSIVDYLGGRTDPDQCQGGAPAWSALTPTPDLVHRCLITNPDGKGFPRAEVQLKSNRRSFIYVKAPPGAAYVWVDQWAKVRDVLAYLSAEDRGTYVVLPKAEKMTAGYYRPNQAQQLPFTVGVNGVTKAMSLATALLNVVGLDYRKSLQAAALVVGICGSEFSGPANPDRVFDYFRCITTEALGQLQDDNRAVLSAIGMVGQGEFYTGGRAAVLSVATKLNLLGKALAVLGIGGIGRDAINDLLTEIAQFIAPQGSTVKLLLDPARVKPPTGGGGGTGGGSRDVRLSISGSCTTSGGKLLGSASGFKPGGGVTYRAWYPNGSAYTSMKGHGTARLDGTAGWGWPCGGDPAGDYTAEMVDDASGASTGRVGFTIGRSSGGGGGGGGNNHNGGGSGGGQQSTQTVVSVYNQVTNGSSGMREDPQPAYLSTQAAKSCRNRECKLDGTEMGSGHRLVVFCQTGGETTTNGNNNNGDDAGNPGRFTSDRYYGAQWDDGRTGFISQVWINPSQRGGLGLPGC